MTGYQKRLFMFLSVATFFEGYDFFALTQILPNLREEFGLSPMDGGLLFAFVNLGTVVAWLLVRRADRHVRRHVLMITIIGYTVFTFLSGLAWDVYSFAVFQFIARIFLIAEWATCTVYAAEEFSAHQRGTVVGIIQAFSSFGAILCAGLTPLLLSTSYGWRSVYFVGVLPLVLVAYIRRDLKETRRYEDQASASEKAAETGLFHIWRTPYRKRMLQMGAIWFLTYACSNIAVSFWKEFAVGERAMSDGDVGAVLTVAALVSLPLVFLAGKLLDVIGRRKSAVLIFGSTITGVYLAYSLESRAGLTIALTISVFGVSSVLPLLNAYTTELFPTSLRGDAFAWTNNLIGRIGYVLSPILVGSLAETWGWGAAVRPTVVFPMVALALLLLLLPETNALELEETSALP